MRIAQIVLPGASEYERKSQRADHAALAEKHDVIVVPIENLSALEADIAHVYASGELPSAPFVRFPIPYVSSAPLRPSRWSFRKPVPPRAIVSPLGEEPLPEVVEDAYFIDREPHARAVKIIGSFERESVRNVVEQTMARIHRFRDDVEWRLHRAQPSPSELTDVDLWVDPAVAENDFDGFTGEALVVGLPVVAARTPINVLRLEKGHTGFLAPPRDPNEMTHAILAALFKTEVAQAKQNSARMTVSKFRARQRLRVLTRIYETLI